MHIIKAANININHYTTTRRDYLHHYHTPFDLQQKKIENYRIFLFCNPQIIYKEKYIKLTQIIRIDSGNPLASIYKLLQDEG